MKFDLYGRVRNRRTGEQGYVTAANDRFIIVTHDPLQRCGGHLVYREFWDEWEVSDADGPQTVSA